MDWESAISDFVTYLRLEKSLSDNSIEAYRHDVMKLYQYLIATDQSEITPEKITIEHLHEFLYWINHDENEKINERSQARIISGIKNLLEEFTEATKSDSTEMNKIRLAKNSFFVEFRNVQDSLSSVMGSFSVFPY